jgi:hypothetical protein
MHPAKMDSRGWSRHRHSMWDKQQLQPEKKLMLAVLEDALARFDKHLPRQNGLFREELNWFMDTNSEPVFSFENICAALQLEPSCVRKYLLRSAMVAPKSLSSARERRQDRSDTAPFELGRMLRQRSPVRLGQFFVNPQIRGFHSRIFSIVHASRHSQCASPAPGLSTKRRNI